MITIQQVFDTAIHLLDEQNESSGATGTQDTSEYKYRTVNILNALIQALYPYSSTYDPSMGGRPSPKLLSVESYQNPDFTQTIPLDDALAIGILPYGLAAQLSVGDNTELASWMRGQYNAAFADLRYKAQSTWEPISTPYGLF